MTALRKIIHIDMDCFYAAVEIRNNPSLKNRPVAVGGSPDKRGVLTTCNYEARKFGLHSAMPTAQAIKRCPHLVLLPVNMPLYQQVSQQIHQIFKRYTPFIEPLSLDEAYLDVTESTQCQGSATWIAEAIRQAIFEELQLTASAGVAPLKFLAKIASDQNKPNGLFVIQPNEVADFVAQLPLKKIPGVGKVTAEKLTALGLTTCADIQAFDLAELIKHFGKLGQRIWAFSHCQDDRRVEADRLRKSVGVEITLHQNIDHLEQGLAMLDKLYLNLMKRLQNVRQKQPLASPARIGVKLKFDDFQATTLEKSHLSCDQDNFAELLKQIWVRKAGRSIRLIGLHIQLQENVATPQLDLWS